MIRKVLATAAVALFLASSAGAQQQPPPAAAAPPAPPDFSKVEIKTTDLGDNVYMLEGQGGNITVAVAKTGIIMVDGQYAPLHDKIKAAIANISNLPIKYLINTHYHGDHTGGNELFAKDGVLIVAQINVKKRLEAGTTNGLTGAKTPPAAAGALPGDTYTNFSKIRLPGRVADLKNIPNAHTDGDTYVWFKTANVLATGDTFTNGRYPNIDFANGGNIKGMIAAADAYLKLTNAKSRIVPGHGPVADKAVLHGISRDAGHRARPHGQARQGRQERGRRDRGKAVCRSRQEMGADRAGQHELDPRGVSFACRRARRRRGCSSAS